MAFINEKRLVANNLFGRNKILLDIPSGKIDSEQLINILNYSLRIHEVNRRQINYLYNYYRGDQPIIYRTDKVVRPEIDNRSVENWAKYVADFKNGFIWGEPIQLIKNSDEEDNKEVSDGVDKQVLLLNKYYQSVEKHKKDKECGFWSSVTGVGYMCALPSKEQFSKVPFNLYTLDPRSTYIIYSDDFKQEPVMAVTYSIIQKESEDIDYKLTIYTKEYSYNAVIDGSSKAIRDYKEHINVLGMIPIIEFNYNTVSQGSFEHVLPLLDNLNLICSDRMNDVEQAVQWFMKFINVDIDKDLYDDFKKKGVIVARGEPGNPPIIDSVINTLDQQQIQIFKDDMVRCVHILCSVPERTADPGNNTGQALIVGQGWAGAESDAKNVEALQISSQKQLLKVVLRICEINGATQEKLGDVEIENIDIKYTRNRSDNLLIKTQSLKNMLDSGVHPLLAFKICGLFSDPQKSFELSKVYIERFYERQNKKVSDYHKKEINTEENEHNMSMQQQKEIDKEN